MLFRKFAHGTHVAGIAVEGNPYAKILTARMTFPHKIIPEPPTIETTKKSVKSMKETVQYFQQNGVRLVNMSWGGSFKNFESVLEKNGIGKDAEDRKRMAREIFDISSEGLYNAIKSAPEILFITAAGNIDSDVSFDESQTLKTTLVLSLTHRAIRPPGMEPQ